MVDVTWGENVTVVQPVNLYGCTIGDHSFVGPFVEIQRGAVVGRRCKIQSHAFLCDLVTIGDDCFISHGAMFINDPFEIGGPAQGRRQLWRSTQIGNQVSIGKGAIPSGQTALLVTQLQPLPPGLYAVYWSVIARDGHHTEGRWYFTVK